MNTLEYTDSYFDGTCFFTVVFQSWKTTFGMGVFFMARRKLVRVIFSFPYQVCMCFVRNLGLKVAEKMKNVEIHLQNNSNIYNASLALDRLVKKNNPNSFYKNENHRAKVEAAICFTCHCGTSSYARASNTPVSFPKFRSRSRGRIVVKDGRGSFLPSVRLQGDARCLKAPPVNRFGAAAQ